MKKLVFMFVAIAAISFASCGNKTAQTAATAESQRPPLPAVCACVCMHASVCVCVCV